MARSTANTKAKKERGMALLLTLFALLLLSAIGLFMVLSSMTETRIDTNYGTGLRAYYSARSGLEEARDRITYPSTSTTKPGGLADLLPQDIAGDTNGVLYVLNPAGGETVDPTDPTSPYFDDELCHDYNSGTPRDIKCTMVPVVPNWQLAPQFSLAPASGQMGYKWIRINIKTNRIADPYFVDQNLSGMPVDTRICWDGQTEQLSPGGKNPSCDANGMQTVYMLTALAATPQARGLNGARKLLRAEIVAPSIRPAGALTATVVNLPTSGGVPPLAIDGRAYDINGKAPTSNSCSQIAPLATDSGSTQLEQALNQIRKSIVQTANASCNADGTGLGANLCPPALWWVRGTNLSTTRFVTASSGTTSGTTGGGHDGHGGSDDDAAPIGVSIGASCDPTSPNCYTHLDLAAPQLFGIAATTGPNVPTVTPLPNAVAPFVGNPGNQSDATIYQPSGSQTVIDQIAAVNNLVTASANQANYFKATSATLASSYGSSTAPAIVVFSDLTVSDPTLRLQSGTTLTGYGVLVVRGSLEINGTLNWNGIVVITSATGHVTIGSGATGQINGALLMQPGATFNFPNATASGASSGPSFLISYSCEAIDLPFSTLPFKIISTTESSF